MKNEEPAWLQNPLLAFFASVKLAMVLLAVLIVATIAGTIYESSFDARVARAYIYNASWFNFWLLLLSANLIFSAFSRMPWKRHHTGFLLTHLGIIVLLAGALIGRLYGVEGSRTIVPFARDTRGGSVVAGAAGACAAGACAAGACAAVSIVFTGSAGGSIAAAGGGGSIGVGVCDGSGALRRSSGVRQTNASSTPEGDMGDQ